MLASTSIRTVLLSILIISAAVGAHATPIFEDFASGSWDPNDFELDGTGSAASGAYSSTGGTRGLLRTVLNDFVPTTSSPLQVIADLTFSDNNSISFLGLRSNGLRSASFHNEPRSSVYLRIHNFGNGYTTLTAGSNLLAVEEPGNAFFAAGQAVRVSVLDTGSFITATFTNLVTANEFSFSASTSESFGGRVVFSTGDNDTWDNISISVVSISAPSMSMMTLVAMLILGCFASNRRQLV